MREFHLTIECRETGQKVETTRSELMESSAELEGSSVELRNGVVFCDDTRLADGKWMPEDDEAKHHFRLTAKEKFVRAEELEERYKNKYCMNCFHWDREEGVRLYEEQTHKYGDGSFSRVEQIIRAVAQHNKTRPLTPSNIGYCPLHLRLCPESAKACVEHYDPRPWLARVRNWWTRMFK